MKAVKDRRGEKYGRLSPISYFMEKNNKNKNIVFWICKCDCGNENVVARGTDLGRSINSCGCLRDEQNRKIAQNNKTHGMAGKRFYKTWRSIIDRCENRKHESYKYYGERGVTVCEEWKLFDNFMNDMYESYVKHSDNHGEINTSIERIDVNKGYSKENCKWETNKNQSRNRRTNRCFVAEHEEFGTYTENVIVDFADKFNLDTSCITKCLKGKRKHHKGWSFRYYA